CGLPQCRLLRLHRGLGHALGLRALIEGLLRDSAAAHETLPTLQVGLGIGKVGTSLRQVCLRLRQRGFEGSPIDGEQEVALLHQLAVLEVNGVEVARDARTHLDGVDGHEATDVLIVIRYEPLGGFGHRDLWRRRGPAGGARLSRFTAGEAYDQRQQPGDDAQRPERLLYPHAMSLVRLDGASQHMVSFQRCSRSAREDVMAREQAWCARLLTTGLKAGKEGCCASAPAGNGFVVAWRTAMTLFAARADSNRLAAAEGGAGALRPREHGGSANGRAQVSRASSTDPIAWHKRARPRGSRVARRGRRPSASPRRF